jgi:hypothetical protein
MANIAAFSQFYQQPTGTPLGYTLGDIGLEKGNAQEDYGINRFKMTRDYNRGMGDLVDRFSGRGTARSGILSKAADRMREDYNFNTGDSERLLRRQLADLDRQRLLATVGVLS